MVEIDVKDKKILHNLIIDSRQSLTSIGKKVGISKELALYRIKRLQDKKIIIKNTISINAEKLGYSVLNFYYNFANVNPSIKKEIIDHFVKSDQIAFIGSMEGLYDLKVTFLVGNPIEFEVFFEKTQLKYRKYFSKQSGNAAIRLDQYLYSFLVNEKTNIFEPIKLGWGVDTIPKLDNLDLNILKILSENSRIPTKEIANKLDSTITIVNNRINKLKKNGVIINFTIHVAWKKLDYHFFSVEVIFSDFSEKNRILKYLRKNPYLINIIKPLGFNCDLEFLFCLKNVKHLRGIIEDLTTKFPTAIKSCDFSRIYEAHKNCYIPPRLLNTRNPFHKRHND